jgi:type II secretory pathway component PulF
MSKPLDYIPPKAVRRTVPFSVGAFCCSSVWYVAIVVYGAFYFPFYERAFSALGIELPLLTKTLLGLADFIRSEHGWLILLPVPIVAAFVVGMIDERRSSTWRNVPLRLRIAFWLFLSMSVVFFGHVIVNNAMVMPLWSITIGVAAGGPPATKP